MSQYFLDVAQWHPRVARVPYGSPDRAIANLTQLLFQYQTIQFLLVKSNAPTFKVTTKMVMLQICGQDLCKANSIFFFETLDLQIWDTTDAIAYDSS